jgi:hypothetical protein
MVTWNVEVKRFYIPSKTKRTKKGKPVLVPVTIRKMFVVDKNPITDSGFYRIVRLDRRGEVTFSLSALPRIPQLIWANPSGKCEEWFKVGADYKRTDDKPMNRVQVLRWLAVRMGLEQATMAVQALETQEPEVMSKAA